MKKKKKSAPGAKRPAPAAPPAPAARGAASSRRDGVPQPHPRRLGLLIGLFAAAFALAFGLAWLLFRPGAAPAPAAPAASAAPAAAPETPAVAPPLTREELAPFLQAAAAADIEAMFRLGPDLFSEGRAIPGRGELLAEYETNSFPPYQVYAFYAGIRDGTVHRVLLTVGDDDRVVSFLAEAMPID